MILGLAPMDGYTDCAFREITQEIFNKYGKPSLEEGLGGLYLWTEFMTADGYCANPQAVIKHLQTSPNQKNLIAQIHGGNIDTLLKTVKDINNFPPLEGLQSNIAGGKGGPFIGIELNTGCPANNIMKSGGGSELLKDKEKTLQIIKSLKSVSKLPFSIKTRTGLNEKDKEEQKKFIIEASKFCSMITIHGRTVKQAYTGEADRDFIYDIKKYVGTTHGASAQCKIIGNGGINSYSQIQEKIGNLDGVMIGQAAIGNPRILTPHQPSLQEKRDTIIKHLDLMLKYNNDQPEERIVVEFRKHLFQYIKGITDSREFKVRLSEIKTHYKLVNEIKKFLS